MQALSRLVATDEWAALRKALEARYHEVADGLLSCGSWEQYQKLVGAVLAYEEIMCLPDMVVAKEEELREHERTRESDRIAADQSRRAREYGSRLWNTRPRVDGAGGPSH